MTTQPKNVFIVQTAASSRDGRSKGGNISLINKQSSLYKYRQQKKLKETKTSPHHSHTSPPLRNLETHRSSWLLESRLPKTAPAPDDVLTDCDSSSPEEDHTQVLVAYREDRSLINEWEYDIDEDARLHNCYAGLRTDPFCCMPIEDSSMVLGLSDLYTNMMLPHLSQSARVLNVQDVYEDVFWQMVFQEDTIDIVATMCYCADASWRSGHGFIPDKALFVHHGRSLARLKQRLPHFDKTNVGIIISMLMYNSNFARVLGNFQAAKQHMSMLRRILKKDPTLLESLGYRGKLKPLLLQWDYFLTLNNGEEPIVPARISHKSEYPSIPLNDELSDLVKTLPVGFQKLANTGRLSCQVLRLLGRSQELLVAVANGTSKKWLAMPGENRSTDYRAALPCLATSEDDEDAALERLISYAVILFTWRLLSPVKTATWSLPASGGRAQITQQALNCRADTNAEKHCLIWLWLVGIDAWGIVSGAMPVKGQVLMQQLKARYPEAANWRHLSRVVKEFFWTDDLELACRSYWKPEQRIMNL